MSMIDDNACITVGVLVAVLDYISTPTFVLRPDGHIVHLNGAGTKLLRRGGALRKVHSRLVARRSKEAEALAGVIIRVAESQCPEMFRLLSRDGTLRLLMTVSPIPTYTLVTISVADLQADGSGVANWLQQAFDLSPQNAELAESLMFGLSLAEFCVDRSITLGAVRTRLKKLFARTGKSSQAALVSALLRAAVVAPPDFGSSAIKTGKS
jgi:DNA-binding CsgD family transcriptional regulator